jgi:dienelactone hydrolase
MFNTIHFPSKDSLTITADSYPVESARGLMLLCHRSHCNRGEYRETAPRLNALGYSALAIDQRSGMKIFGVVNETSLLAKQKNLATGYLEARPDIEAAIDYAYRLNQQQKIILVGSSYSASLALLIATHSDKLKALVVFSPGEYLKKTNVAHAIRDLAIPTFVTGSKKEIEDAVEVMRFVNSHYVTLFKPDVEGFHGSKTLWKEVKGSETYWQALEQFLNTINHE